MRFSRFSAMTMPSTCGTAPPDRLVPLPRATNGTPRVGAEPDGVDDLVGRLRQHHGARTGAERGEPVRLERGQAGRRGEKRAGGRTRAIAGSRLGRTHRPVIGISKGDLGLGLGEPGLGDLGTSRGALRIGPSAVSSALMLLHREPGFRLSPRGRCATPPARRADRRTSRAAGPAAAGAEGFTALFNGRDLSGWTGAVDGYEVKDGAIVCKPGQGGTLFTRGRYRNFVVRLEFKLPPAGNNGLAIRYPGTGDSAYVGMTELQVLDDTDPKYATLDPRQAHGSAYGMVASTRGHLKPVGQWNEQEVTVRGSRIKVVLNGRGSSTPTSPR